MFKRKKETTKEIVTKGIALALAEVVYVGLVALVMMPFNTLFHPGSKSMIFGVVAMLSLLVMSAAVSGALVLGYPAYYFLQKKYREGVILLGATLATILIIFILIILGEIFIY